MYKSPNLGFTFSQMREQMRGLIGNVARQHTIVR